ncbi:MAG: serine/threonine-protein kinase [Cyanobacteria bacterium]|nr:serine/threonine-protein kinase [Cyanobacteriota bacterium]
MNSTKLFSDLKLLQKIGSGHFGEVYLGQDHVLGRVAVKVLRKTSQETEAEWRARKSGLLQEGRHLKSAEHERVVRVFQVLESDTEDAIHMVMEFCGNGSLQSKFEQGPLELAELRDILTDAALGLQTVHSRGMLHRDIKPANLLIDENGHAKLADFGLVTDNLLLGYASAVGYSDHLAKEVFEDGLTSIKSDIWAFGMTAYRLLHGLAFYSELPQPRHLIERGRYALKLPWLPHIPDRWRRFIRQAMHDDPSCRLQNSFEILQALEKLPIEPNWKCTYSQLQTIWTRTRGDRKIEVVCLKHSPRRYEWKAQSLPLNNGKKRNLGGSNGCVGKTKTMRQLDDFFQNQS